MSFQESHPLSAEMRPGRDTVCIRTGGMLQKYNADGFKIFEKVYYSTNNTEKLIFNNLIECKRCRSALVDG